MQISLTEWDDFYKQHPHAHLLQSGAWGELKSGFGWKAERVICGTAGAQILFRVLPGGYTVGYIPKGPIGHTPALFSEIDKVCNKNRAIFLKVEPDLWEPAEDPSFINEQGWKLSQSIQPRRTVVISLHGAEEDILNRMKQKTRYNIRLAQKKEIEVRSSGNIDEFHAMAKVTSQRDGFGVHSLDYYQKAFELFHPSGNCELLTAYYATQPLASLFVFSQGEMAYYMYGASSDQERNRMPAYLIQWEAMRWAKQKGCLYYDLWGVPDLDEDELEGSFQQKDSHQGLWGVYRFKRGFGGETWRSVGAWDRVYSKSLYSIYTLALRLRGSQAD